MPMKSLPTLKGVFPEPKPIPKRDFLRENKQKLKAVQKLTAQKQISKENDEHCSRRTQDRNLQGKRSRCIPINRINSGCSCSLKTSQDENAAVSIKQVPRQTSNCDKSIQTDDIVDETFLSNALRKCSSRESTQIDNNIDASTQKLPYIANLHSSKSEILNVDLSPINENKHFMQLSELALSNFRPKNGLQDTQRDELCKIQNKISNRSDLRSRKEVKIPKYLEREKREKELQRIQEMEKDPHCPEGHYALSNEERKEALKAAENKFKELVDELNRMPMSGETLKIRNRKIEIEKALVQLENSIRTFEKQKVYVKTDK